MQFSGNSFRKWIFTGCAVAAFAMVSTAVAGSYELRSDYAWQSSFTSTEWFSETSKLSWAHGRDDPWLRVEITGDPTPPIFHRGDCKGGSTSRWGYAVWSLEDSDFQP